MYFQLLTRKVNPTEDEIRVVQARAAKRRRNREGRKDRQRQKYHEKKQRLEEVHDESESETSEESPDLTDASDDQAEPEEAAPGTVILDISDPEVLAGLQLGQVSVLDTAEEAMPGSYIDLNQAYLPVSVLFHHCRQLSVIVVIR